jgi:hypothetical protein
MTYLNICDIQVLKYDIVLQHSIQIIIKIAAKTECQPGGLTLLLI